jgi:hypothetical protein
MILRDKLFEQAHDNGGHVDLTGLTRAVNLAATTDLRGQDLLPWISRVIGHADGQDAQMLKILRAWHRSGSNRLDANGDNIYDHSAAVALMDAWWPRLVRAQFEPALGTDLFNTVEGNVLGLGGFGWDWGTAVQKDLRSVLGAPEKGRYSRIYCGGPHPLPTTAAQRRQVRAGCKALLLATLRDAVAAVSDAQGSSDPAAWEVHALCDSGCDQIEPNTAGAVDTPPFPWQNRGTFHQIDEITGHR